MEDSSNNITCEDIGVSVFEATAVNSNVDNSNHSNSNSEGEESGSDTSEIKIARNVFAFDSDSGSSDDSSSDSEGKDDTSNYELSESMVPVKDKTNNASVKKDNSNKDNDEDDYAFLDAIIEGNKALDDTNTNNSLLTSDNSDYDYYRIATLSQKFFTIDAKLLDIDYFNKKRYGTFAGLLGNTNGIFDNNHNRRNRGNATGNINRSNINRNKKYLFGTPKDDWIKVPGFGLGGIGMERYIPSFGSSSSGSLDTKEFHRPNDKKNSNKRRYKSKQYSDDNKGSAIDPVVDNFQKVGIYWYRYTWSKEFDYLTSQYNKLSDMNDVNLIIMFLAHYPYHPIAQLLLCNIYSRMQGRMERANDLVRRCLFSLESAFIATFKPYSGLCRMDPFLPQNEILYSTLLCYLKFLSIQGSYGIAADLCRLLLSLNPADDMYGLLLLLDSLLVAAGQHDLLLQYCDIDNNSGSNVSDGTVMATEVMLSSSYNLQFAFTPNQLKQQLQMQNDLCANIDNTNIVLPLNNSSLAIGIIDHLPNWWYSLALSTYLEERKVSSDNNTIKSKNSTHLLKVAMARWSFMVEPLMTCNGVNANAASWKTILDHSLFCNSKTRIPESSYLNKVCEVYRLRNTALWGREDVQKWVMNAANGIIGDLSRLNAPYNVDRVIDRQRILYKQLSSSVLNTDKYNSVEITDFADSITFLPADAAMIDPMLDDPHIVNGHVKFQNFMDQNGNFLPPLRDAITAREENGAMLQALRDIGVDDVTLEGQLRRWWGGLGDAVFNNNNILRDQMAVAQMHDIDPNNEDDDFELPNQRHRAGLLHRRQREINRNNSPTHTIDLNLPLMQLFLATIFPWVHVPRYQRR